MYGWLSERQQPPMGRANCSQQQSKRKQKTNRVKLKGSSEPRAYPYQTLDPAGSATMQNTSLKLFRAAVG